MPFPANVYVPPEIEREMLAQELAEHDRVIRRRAGLPLRADLRRQEERRLDYAYTLAPHVDQAEAHASVARDVKAQAAEVLDGAEQFYELDGLEVRWDCVHAGSPGHVDRDTPTVVHLNPPLNTTQAELLANIGHEAFHTLCIELGMAYTPDEERRADASAAGFAAWFHQQQGRSR